MITYLGIDTGGTFTDFVALDAAGLRMHKELSTPDAPERAILAGLAALGLTPDRSAAPLVIVHGSTVATNAVLEGKGARTAFVTNRGFADLLTIGRQARSGLYDLRPAALPPPVPVDLCVETGGRLGAGGELVDPLTEADLDALVARLTALAPQAVAVTLLFSFADPTHEHRIMARLAAALPEVFVCCSADVLPEIREYERGIATWLNAFVGPMMQGYLARLDAAVAPARLSVMQSSGLACTPDWAGRHAVNLLLSGPAGGVQGARWCAGRLGCEEVLTFDMGGTSTDVAYIDREPILATEGRVGAWPVGVAMVDIHTIGAGGGSLARLDEGGLLRVGPASAGARPGPACYDLGGREPTVTDAHVVLGRLPGGVRLAGRLALDADAARRAFAPLAAMLGTSVEAAAQGVVDLANEHMHQALRVMSVARGRDPRAALLLSFGGAGGLHVCELAAELGMRSAIVPAAAGVLSALGMLTTGPGRQCVASIRLPLERIDPESVAARYAALDSAARAELALEGVVDGVHAARSVDLCYEGQSTALNLPWQPLADLEAAFHAAHARRYGHRLTARVLLVALRLRLSAPAAPLTMPRRTVDAGTCATTTVVHGIGRVPIWPRDALPGDVELAGPLVVTDMAGTTWVAPGWTLRLDADGHLRLSPAV